jgi:hypothetical protein
MDEINPDVFKFLNTMLGPEIFSYIIEKIEINNIFFNMDIYKINNSTYDKYFRKNIT